MTWEARQISLSIARPPRSVAEFAANPRNLPVWTGWGSPGVRERRGRWYLRSGDDDWAEIVFTGPHEAGVLDHEVRYGDGRRMVFPMRVVPNDDGSELIYTMFRQTDEDDDTFEASIARTTANLETLRRILES